MTGAPPAALAAIHAALIDAHHAGDPPEQAAQRVIDELAEQGWHITAPPAHITN